MNNSIFKMLFSNLVLRPVHQIYGTATKSYFSETFQLGNATRVPENPGNPPVFKPVNPTVLAVHEQLQLLQIAAMT